MVTAQQLFWNWNPKDEQKTWGITAKDLFWTKNSNTPSIRDSLKDVEQSKYWFAWSFVNDVKGFFWDIWDLVSYWRTEFVSNKDKRKWINDWDEYKKRMKQMSTSKLSLQISKHSLTNWIVLCLLLWVRHLTDIKLIH